LARRELNLRILEGEQWMIRIFIGESDCWKGRPLADALVERLRKEGFAGATVLRGLACFGARSVVHTAHLLELSQDLPKVIEVVDGEEHVQRLEPILDEMVADGLVTLEKVRVLKYKPATGGPSATPQVLQSTRP
jgi:PII-like signaling protein